MWLTQDVMSVVLFNVVPQLIDVAVACTYMAAKLQPWTAIIVFVTGGEGAVWGGEQRRREGNQAAYS